MNIVISPMCLGRPQEVLNPYIIVSSYFKYVKFNDFFFLKLIKWSPLPQQERSLINPQQTIHYKLKDCNLEQVYRKHKLLAPQLE
jgi:hypothetical protein